MRRGRAAVRPHRETPRDETVSRWCVCTGDGRTGLPLAAAGWGRLRYKEEIEGAKEDSGG